MDTRLHFARELERRDMDVAERLERLARLAAEVARIRTAAAEHAAFLARLPARGAHLDAAEREAAQALADARLRVADAERARARAHGADARAGSARDVESAAVAVHAADERRERVAAQRAAIEREVEQAAGRARSLARLAAAGADELAAAPRVTAPAPPGEGLEDVLDWAGRAHAALLVARAGLEAERDHIFREANELASTVLGVPLQSTSVGLVRRRLEELLA